jgi:hypothetical protein
MHAVDIYWYIGVQWKVVKSDIHLKKKSGMAKDKRISRQTKQWRARLAGDVCEAI